MSDFVQNFLVPTKTVYVEWVVIAVIAIGSFLATRKMKEVPGMVQNVAEVGIGRLYRFFEEIMGKETKRYFPVLATFFIFIVFCNYTGEMPFAGWKYPVATSHLAVTVALGLCGFIFIHASGIKRKGIKHYILGTFKPVAFLFPLTILEQLVRPLSLSLRLYGNIYGEDMVTESLYGMVPIALPWLMNVLSLMFCLIQAMVFTMLLAIFVSEAVETEEE